MTPQFSQLPLGALRQHLGTAAAVGAAEAPEVHAAGSADRWDEEEAKLGIAWDEAMYDVVECFRRDCYMDM